IVVVAASAGSALVETGVGPVIGWGLAAWRTEQMLVKLNRAAIVAQAGGGLVMGFAGWIQEVNWRLGELKNIGLPGTAYDHPAVTR
ncbi:MAG TPA: hypothetical protein VJY85_09790, partial [Candidatus Limnocylindria bacterium]|nr:hypothetical protein [Candidatus Limnocylindria bacterium]